MSKLLVFLGLVAVLAISCSSVDYEAGKRREMFRLPHYTGIDKPSLDRAGQLSLDGSSHYYKALLTDDPLEKKRLLRIAADNYQSAIEELEALRADTAYPDMRERLSFIIMHLREDLNDTIRQIPITGE